MKGREVVVLAVMGILAVAALFAGCGSSSGDSTNASATEGASETTAVAIPSGPLTKAEFIKHADQICQAGVKKKEDAVLSLAQLAAESGKPPSASALEKVATVVILPTYTETLEQLSQLSAPKGDEATVEDVIKRYEADLETAKAEPLKATKENLFRDANDAGDAYGLTSCHF